MALVGALEALVGVLAQPERRVKAPAGAVATKAHRVALAARLNSGIQHTAPAEAAVVQAPPPAGPAAYTAAVVVEGMALLAMAGMV